MRARAKAGMALVGMALLAAACGGGSDGGDQASSTREEFAARVDAACADREASLEGVDGGLDDEATILRVISLNEDLLREVEGIAPPADAQAPVDRLLALIEEQNALLQDHADALAAGDAPDEDALVEQLEAQDEEFDVEAAELGLDGCRSAGEETDTTLAADTGAESAGVPALEEVADLFIDYMDAYWGVDPEREKQLTTAWADALAGYHSASEISLAGPTPPQEAHVELSLTGIEPSAVGGWNVEGLITVTTDDATYSYTDLIVQDDPVDGLAVAEYCRTSPDGYGPLQGCVSSAVGDLDVDFAPDDEAYRLQMGPFVRAIGLGAQATEFSLCLEGVTTAVEVSVATEWSFATETSSMPADGVLVAPAAPGSRSCGTVRLNTPMEATDEEVPEGVLRLVLEKGDGTSVTAEVPTPSLPDDLR